MCLDFAWSLEGQRKKLWGFSLEHELGHLVLRALQLVVDVLQDDADHLHHRDDEGTKRQRAQVIPGINTETKN